jgi:hypothetical protein
MTFAIMVYPARLKNERQRKVWLRKLILRKSRVEFYRRVDEICKQGGVGIYVDPLDYTGVEILNI